MSVPNLGERVFHVQGGVSPLCTGIVVAMDEQAGKFTVEWDCSAVFPHDLDEWGLLVLSLDGIGEDAAAVYLS
jgi:hypothetical protein